jgi:hypothetical protein
MVDQKIQDTIAALLAKARGTDNENEAAIFMAKAQELLARHNLDEAQLRGRDAKSNEPVGEHRYRDSVAKWRSVIAQGCAKLYFCSCLTWGKEFRFVGKAHNAEVAISMTDWLCAVVKRMAREYSSDRKTQGEFYYGAAMRLYQRLVALYQEQNPVAPTAKSNTSDGRAMVLLYTNEEAEVKGYLSQYNLRTRKSKGSRYTGASAAGAAAANGIQLNKQVSETRSSRMIGSR